MDEHISSADILCDGIHHGVELPHRNRLVVLDRQMHVMHIRRLVPDGLFAERDDGRNPLWIRSREPLGILEATNKEAFPDARHWAPSSRFVFWGRLACSSRVNTGIGVLFLRFE